MKQASFWSLWKTRILGSFVTSLLLLYTLSLASFGVLILVFLIWPIPISPWRRFVQRFLQRVPSYWNNINHYILQITNHGKLHLIGDAPLKKNGWYIVLSNHQNWADILIISNLLRHRVPALKFFMKKSLIWRLPIAGFLCHHLGYPMMNRHTSNEVKKNPALKGQDIATTRDLCKEFRERPTSIINFVEGTRFTEKKREQRRSPFRYLLKPKAGGVAIVLEELHDILDGIINITIHYEGDRLNVWNFVCGRYTKIDVHYEVLPITADIIGNYHEDRAFRVQFQNWLNRIWVEKDHLLRELK